VRTNIYRIAGRTGLVALLCATTALTCQAAAAQEAAPQSGGAGEHSSGAMPDIVVTAEFRANRLQDTPLAITAASAEMIEAKGQTGIAEVAMTAPSVTLNAGGTAGGAQATQITIRGIGQTDFNVAVEPGVGIYVDDVYQGIMYASTPELLDLDRVEILRGPQGTLSGRNSIGGAIRLISKRPDDKEGGYLEASYGRFNSLMVRGGVNFALVPNRLFLRINGLAKESDGFLTRLDYQCVTGTPPSVVNSPGSLATPANGCKIGTLGGQSVAAVRASMRAILSDAIENTVTFDYTNDKSEPSANVLIYQGPWRGAGYNLTSNPPVPNPTQNFVTAGRYVNYANFTAMIGTPNQYTAPARSDANSWGVTNNLEVNMGDLQLKSITSFRKIETMSAVDLDASPISRNMQIWGIDHEQFTQELRLSGSVGDFADWTFGGFYYHGNSLQFGRVNLDGAGAALPVFAPFDFAFSDPVKVRSKAAFVHSTFHLAEGLNLTGGLRYTDERKSYQFGRSMVPGVTPSSLSASVLPLNGLTGQFSGNRWDYRVALDYKVTPTINIYGQVATGFKGGGVNPRPFYAEQVRPFNPETVTSYEIGVKSELFDRRVRLNSALYYNDYKGMQLTLLSCPQFVPAGARQNCQMTANVGDATIKGFEVEVDMRPVEGLGIDGSLSYTDFQYKRVDATTGVTRDMRAPYASKWKASAGVQYRFDLGDNGSITPRLDVRYQSRAETQAINNSLNFIEGYALLNGRLSYLTGDERVEFALTVKNLTGKYYYTNLYDQAFQSYAFLSGQPGRPREWNLSARYKF